MLLFLLPFLPFVVVKVSRSFHFHVSCAMYMHTHTIGRRNCKHTGGEAGTVRSFDGGHPLRLRVGHTNRTYANPALPPTLLNMSIRGLQVADIWSGKVLHGMISNGVFTPPAVPPRDNAFYKLSPGHGGAADSLNISLFLEERKKDKTW